MGSSAVLHRQIFPWWCTHDVEHDDHSENDEVGLEYEQSTSNVGRRDLRDVHGGRGGQNADANTSDEATHDQLREAKSRRLKGASGRQ